MESRTICEVNCRLVQARISDDGSISCSKGTPLGAEAFPDIQLDHDNDDRTDELAFDRDSDADGPDSPESRQSIYGNIEEFWQETVDASKQLIGRSLLRAGVRNSQKGSGHQHIAWHTRKQKLAVVAAGSEVQIFTLHPVRPTLPGSRIDQARPTITLHHPEQKDVSALAFRPHNSDQLAVAGNRAVCLWDLSQADNSIHKPACRVLKPRSAVQLSCLFWAPCGAFLAAGHLNAGGFSIWDVATGEATLLRTGLMGRSILSWSPNSCYLFTACPNGTFELWETETWTHASWTSPHSGEILNARWIEDSKTLLLAYSGGQFLALVLIGEPPSLNAQLLPVQLPGLLAPGQSLGGDVITAMDCDPTMQRLAIACGQDAEKPNTVLLYTTVARPFFAAKLIGEADFISVPRSIDSLCFHPAYPKGALLAVAWKSGVRTLPLLFVNSTD